MVVEPNSLANGLLLAFAALELLRPRGESPAAQTGFTADRGTTGIVIGCYCIVVVVLNWPTFSVLPLPGWVAWAGLAVSAFGLALRGWAILALRRHRAHDASAPQQLIRSGPYRVIRHPDYLGSLALCVGATAASGNLIALFSVAVAMLAAYAVRISAEEAMLGRLLGSGYDSYRRSSWRLIPFVY